LISEKQEARSNIMSSRKGVKRKFMDFEELAQEDKKRRTRPKEQEIRSVTSKDALPEEKSAPQDVQDILKLLDEMPEIPQLDKAQLEALISKFHRTLRKNTQMRSLYPEEPNKFMESELELNDAIQTLHQAATSPELYPVIVAQGCVNDFKELLAHENTDVTVSAIHLLRELTESDSFDQEDDTILAFALYEELLSGGVIELLVKNMRRLDEKKEEDFNAIYSILSVFENYLNMDEDYCLLITQKTELFQELFFRMRTQSKLDENKSYCAELLSTYVQIGGDEVKQIFLKEKGITKCLKLLNEYNAKDKFTTEEEEYCQNLFNAIESLFTLDEAKVALSKHDRAMEVILEYIKTKKFFKQPAMSLLAFATLDSQEMCAKIVAKKGLKTIFSAFMKGKAKKQYKQNQRELEENLISIVSNLFRNLEDTPYLRLLAKMQEKEFEKVDRLVELHVKYSTRVEEAIKAEAKRRYVANIEGENDNERYERLLGHGLVTLNLVDLVIGFVATAGHNEMRERAQQVLNQQDLDFAEVKKVLREFAINSDNGSANKRGNSLKDTIYAIIKAL